MRALFVIHDSPHAIGGVSTWLTDLLPLLRERGVEPVVAVYLAGGEGFLCRKLRDAKVDFVTCSYSLSFSRRGKWLTESIIRFNAAVVVPNYLVSGFAAASALRTRGVRCVAVLHSDDPFYRELVERRRCGDDAVRFDAVVPVSRFLKKRAAEILGPEFPNTLIPCGVDQPAGFARAPADELRLVYVGRLVQEQKRIFEVATALCRAVDEIPAVAADVIGDGPDREAAEALAYRMKSPRGIRFLGAMPPQDVRRLLPGYQVQVLLSDYEGLPVALLEGMSAGVVPVVTRLRSGVDELVSDGVSGLVVDDRGDGFVRAIRRLRDDPSLWERLSAGARRGSLPFSAAHCADAWANVLHGLDSLGSRRLESRLPVHIPRPRWCPEFQGDLQGRLASVTAVRNAIVQLRMRAGYYRRKLFRS